MIGHLEIATNEAGRVFARGTFRTLALSLNIRLDPIPDTERNSEDAPTHSVLAITPSGEVDVGRAWRKEIKRGEFEGEPMFSLTLDDPSFDKPLNLWAFPRARAASRLELVWSRPRKAPPGQAQAAAADGAGVRGADGDEIPF